MSYTNREPVSWGVWAIAVFHEWVQFYIIGPLSLGYLSPSLPNPATRTEEEGARVPLFTSFHAGEGGVTELLLGIDFPLLEFSFLSFMFLAYFQMGVMPIPPRKDGRGI